MIASQIPTLLVALFTLVLLIVLLRNRSLSMRFTILWFVIDIFIIVTSIFPQILFGITPLFGFESPTNFIFALFIFLALGLTLQLSYELSRESAKIDTLTQEIALANERIDELTK